MSGEEDPALRLTVLGSGTLLPDDDRRSSCYLLEAGATTLLLDCGSGALHGFDRHGVAWRELDGVVFSHYHTDHVGDVAPLLFALRHGVRPPRREPLSLVGPPGLHAFHDALASAHGEHVADPGFPLTVQEVGRRGSWRAPDGGPGVRFHPTPHTDGSVAHRWEAGGAVLGYTGDTGPDPEVAEFMAGVDALICECSLPDSTEMDNHLTPSRVAEIARVAQPGLLLTTHVYPPLKPADVPEMVRAAGYTGRVEAARDGLVAAVRQGEVQLR